jgi:osmotically-inducible protein OsmY
MHFARLPLVVLLSTLACLQGCAGVLLLGGATAAVVATDRRTVGAQIDDKAIVVRSTDALRKTEGLGDDTHINVTSLNGVVLLTGETPTAETRDKVLGAIRTVPAVRRTVNEIQIAPPSTIPNRNNDTWLTSKVKSRLIGVKDLDSTQVKVVTERSVVYLLGLVNRKEGDTAATAASEVDGVQRVVKLFEYVD